MNCLTEEQLDGYMVRSLSGVEMAMVRDHLALCPDCLERYRTAQMLEDVLEQPIEVEPPAIIERMVMRRLFSSLPRLSTVLLLSAGCLLTVITWIYMVFDFAHNSLIRAYRMTTGRIAAQVSALFDLISDVVETMASAVAAVKKVGSILAGLPGMGLASVVTLSLMALLVWRVWRKSRHVALRSGKI